MRKTLLIGSFMAAIQLCVACSNDTPAAQATISQTSSIESSETVDKTKETLTESSANEESPANTNTNKDTDTAASADQQEQLFKSYVNERYGCSITYPADWTTGEESDNGDGKVLYVGNPDVDIRVYASNYMEDVSDPYHSHDENVQQQRVALNNGKEGTLVIGKEDNNIMYDMVYVSKTDVEYHFYAKVSQTFFDQNEKILLKVAKSLDFPDQ